MFIVHYYYYYNKEQFKRSLKNWIFERTYGRRRVWQTLTEGAQYKWLPSELLAYRSEKFLINVATDVCLR